MTAKTIKPSLHMENKMDNSEYIRCLENQNAYMMSLFYAYQRISDEEKKLQQHKDTGNYYSCVLRELTRVTNSHFAFITLNSRDHNNTISLYFDCVKNYDPTAVREFIKVAKSQVDYVHLFLNPERFEGDEIE